jgi:DNA-binding LacI/PurR family transcriptional regulator
LCDQAKLIRQNDESRRFEFFYDIDSHSDNKNHRQLLAAARAQRFKGLIFAGPLYRLSDSPLLEMPLARVGVKMSAEEFRSVPGVRLDAPLFIEKALDWLLQRGRKRVAILTPSGFLYPQVPTGEFSHYFISAAARRGMVSMPCWTLILSPHEREGTRYVVELLMHSRPEQRPDALILADDYFVEPTVAGLLAANISMPPELDVVAHCNYPLPMSSVVPIKFLGLDAGQMLQTLIQVIDAKASGQKVPDMTLVPPVFDHEYKPALQGR